jgi:hypothetical protein
MEFDRCKKLVADILSLSDVEKEEIFKIVHESKCEYTRNNNGIFANLVWFPEETLAKLENYVRFCNQSKKELTKYESLCDVLNHKMHESNATSVDQYKKAPTTRVLDDSGTRDIRNTDGASRISSSLRYYLLKKRYSKQLVQPNTHVNQLAKEEYAVLA